MDDVIEKDDMKSKRKSKLGVAVPRRILLLLSPSFKKVSSL